MRWLADECVDAALVLTFVGQTMTCSVCRGNRLRHDHQALEFARNERRLFLTEDKDFGELVFRFRLEVPGLVLLRIDTARARLKWTRLKAVISQIGEGLFGRYVVVTGNRIRSRQLT